MKYCNKCVLSDNMFSVKISDDGLCNYCKNSKVLENSTNDAEFTFKTNSDNNYDIVLAYSGGKDSSYTLYLLREKYKLRVLAITFDNGFLSEVTYQNIKNVCTTLDVDNLIIAPSSQKLNKIFAFSMIDDSLPKKSLERASSICTYCIALVKMNVYKEAILRRIPYIAFGWTPGQINPSKQVVKLQASMVKSNFFRIKNNILENLGQEYYSLLLPDELLEDDKYTMPALFYPFSGGMYDEKRIIEKISEFGWKKVKNTDSNSTNCLLNSYAIYKHKEKYGFHPYALELSSLVRSGFMSREEALKKINEDLNFEIIESIDKKLNF